ncbi:MAG: hypothetical protein A2Z34_09240 [Planctomycetes bacterium RBG_16_59_8]|nr:MAG: hypothetical protein A2Z34_09240 [Planctomycetes bacterium RBG_16_59_8]
MTGETGTISALYRTVGVTFDTVKTASPKMRECIALAKQAAAIDVSLILVGESGTGKNLLAQAIHNASPRRVNVFYSVNCGAFAETLVQSELFGHEKGAFTGAESARSGIFEIADGGTLFLDEVAELTPAIQTKLLQVIEYRQFRRLGGEKIVTTNTRIIAATSSGLEELRRAGKMKPEFYYRLNQFSISVPPLRERVEDIPLLADHFLKEANRKLGKNIKGFEKAAMASLERYSWPGNVREMKNIILRAAIVAAGKEILVTDLATELLSTTAAEAGDNRRTDSISIADVEKNHIGKILQITGNNKKRTAELLGISRSTLDRKIEEYRIDV